MSNAHDLRVIRARVYALMNWIECESDFVIYPGMCEDLDLWVSVELDKIVKKISDHTINTYLPEEVQSDMTASSVDR